MGDTAVTVGLSFFVCLLISCMVTVLKSLNAKSPASQPIGPIAPLDSLWEEITSTGGGRGGLPDIAYSFKKYKDFKPGQFASMGPATPGKTVDDCDSQCGSTSGCRGFSNDNGCELFNNVSILNRSKNSTTYASNDVGAVKYLHVPFKNMVLPSAPQLWTKNGTLAELVSNCAANVVACKGFSVTGSDAIMYPAIVAMDSQQPGDTYIDKETPASFIREGAFSYSETPHETWSMPASYQMTVGELNGTTVLTDASKFVFFDGKGTGFDAGLQAADKPTKEMSNVLTVTNLAQCQNACAMNAWCQSFTMIGSTQCYQRRELTPQHFPRTDNNGNPCVVFQRGGVLSDCACGSDDYVTCNSFRESRDGTSGTGNTSYVKKQYPLELSCPMSCSNDPNCTMVSYDSRTCYKYKDPPTQRSPSTSNTSVWNFKNFPN